MVSFKRQDPAVQMMGSKPMKHPMKGMKGDMPMKGEKHEAMKPARKAGGKRKAGK